MLPKLYDELTTSASGYSKTFLGTINHCTKCKVTEVRNGSYTLSLETTVNDDCAGMLTSQKIIGVKANPFDSDQLFEIQRTERGTDGIIKVEGKHVKTSVARYAPKVITVTNTQTHTRQERRHKYGIN